MNLPQTIVFLKRMRGFTLIETLVAATIFVAALGGFTTLAVLSLRSATTTELTYTAAKIAQEGMELAIGKRDNHVICIESGSCPISDWQDNLIGSWEVNATRPNDLEPQQRFQSYDQSRKLCFIKSPPHDRGKFGYCGNPGDAIPENFTREVRITKLGEEKILVASIVSWDKRFSTESLKLEEVLFGLP